MKFIIVRKWWLRKQYHFRIVAANGKILCSSQNYYNIGDVRDAIYLIKQQASKAEVKDQFEE